MEALLLSVKIPEIRLCLVKHPQIGDGLILLPKPAFQRTLKEHYCDRQWPPEYYYSQIQFSLNLLMICSSFNLFTPFFYYLLPMSSKMFKLLTDRISQDLTLLQTLEE